MKKSNLVILISTVVLFVILAVIFMLPKKIEKQRSLDFFNSYGNFDVAFVDFYTSVIVTNLDENPKFQEADKNYSEIVSSITTPISFLKRLNLAIQVKKDNQELLNDIKNTDRQERAAGDALTQVNINASRIKDKALRDAALAIADNSKNKLDKLIEYKKIIWNRKDDIIDSMQNIIDEGGSLDGFTEKMLNKSFQKEVENQNESLHELIEELNQLFSDSETAIARFKGLSGLED